ncbi:hypothetical protein GQ55_7G245300 [Panicum hallii var. hallii]|uniref:L-ascorbate oxidase n=1 Tax=Panicum hallii var. hallii TaxID=1504633 RepID=A0A2T7CYL2_9POAL|nr:hypothetical protein GQ55_7G245300 [Panicum hallii var. hallii]
MAGGKPEALFFLLVCLLVVSVSAEGPYRSYDWKVTYGDINPLGTPQQAILINGQFPGPKIECQTNDNLIINVHNNLPEPFLLSWNGLQQRKNSWQDGVSGTNCPIPPGQNFTYHMQAKDQIGSFFYFPSLAFHKAAGGFGAIHIRTRPLIPVPFPPPADEYTLLIGDWYTMNHKDLQGMLDSGRELPFPDGILINGKRSPDGADFTVEQGKTYRLRISNVGLQNTLNLMIQDHSMTLVEVEGTHTVQNSYASLDVHVGQSLSVLFDADRPARDYHVVVSTRFTNTTLRSTAVVRYAGSSGRAFGSLPAGPGDVEFSLNQARSIRTNLTASGPRPNPQGSYHYGSINVTRTIRLASSSPGLLAGGERRYAVNGVSFVEADTPLKLADYYNISGVFRLGGIPDAPPSAAAGAAEEVRSETAVMDLDHRSFVEVVLENGEDGVQSWHLDGHSVFVVGLDLGTWSEESRDSYNLVDAISRCTVQVYPRGWTAVLIALDNVGMWNMRSEVWGRRYLGQQFYLRVYTPTHSLRDELPIPDNALLCGRAAANTSRRLPVPPALLSR